MSPETLTQEKTLLDEMIEYRANEVEEATQESKAALREAKTELDNFHKDIKDIQSRIGDLKRENKEIDKQFKQAAVERKPVIGFVDKQVSNKAAIDALEKHLKEEQPKLVELKNEVDGASGGLGWKRQQEFAKFRKIVMGRIGELLGELLQIDTDWNKGCRHSSLMYIIDGPLRFDLFHESVQEIIDVHRGRGNKGSIHLDGTNNPLRYMRK